jgi:hypothetical protein
VKRLTGRHAARSVCRRDIPDRERLSRKEVTIEDTTLQVSIDVVQQRYLLFAPHDSLTLRWPLDDELAAKYQSKSWHIKRDHKSRMLCRPELQAKVVNG